MSPTVRNIFAVIAGIFLGSVVNMALVNLGPMIVPLPDGADITTQEGLRESIHLMQPANFIFPFLAHALGTLAGAFVAAKLAVSRQRNLALLIGVFFLIGGIMMVVAVGGPLWFKALDLLVAYIPMGYLGGKLGHRG